jgi:hypothetical protein
MERVIKIQSENSIVQTFNNVTTTPTNKNLDFKIPEGGVYDLSESYIALEMELIDPTQPIGGVAVPFAKMTMGVDTNNFATFAENHIGDGTLLVRNAQLYSQRRGMLESIRRVDTLGMIKHSLEKDDQEIQCDMNALGVVAQHRLEGVLTSPYCDEVRVSQGDGIDVNGNGDNVSRNRPHEQRIKLKDLFGLGSAKLFSTDKYGECKMNLELNLDKLKMGFIQGQEGNNPAGQDLNSAQNQLAVASGADISAVTLVATATEDEELLCPFSVGQAINCDFTGSVQGVSNQTAIIRDINYAPATNTYELFFTRAVFSGTGGGTEDFTNIRVTPLRAGDISCRINNAELNLTEVMNADAKKVPDEISFITYSTEEMDGAGLAVANKRTHLEPNCQTLYVANCETGKIAPARAMSKYRLAIDNEDVSGNRDVIAFKQLHKDRINRAYVNKNVPLKNLELRLYRHSALQAVMRSERLSVIVEPMELSDEDKLAQLEIHANVTNQDIILYKELVVSK